jgi:hypothetical protein
MLLVLNTPKNIQVAEAFVLIRSIPQQQSRADIYLQWIVLLRQRSINHVSVHRTTAQAATAVQIFARIAVSRAEMPKATAIKNQKAAPMRDRGGAKSW